MKLRAFLSVVMVLIVGCDVDGDERLYSSVSHTNAGVDAFSDVEDDTLLDDSGAFDDAEVTAETPPVDTTAPTDTASPADTTAPTDAPSPADTTPTEAPINPGFVGGACDTDESCNYDDAWCAQADDGFPNGTCSQDCDLYCPDQTGATTTFCVDRNDLGSGTGGMCLMRCDFGVSATGCRAGYRCAPMQRNTQPSTTQYACIPGDGPGPEQSPCIQALVDRGIGFELATNPMDHPDGHPDKVCDIVDPVWVDGTLAGVDFRYANVTNAPKRLFASCPLVLAAYDMAEMAADAGATDIIHLGVYNCRFIGGTTRLSQHAFANAIDVAGVRLSSGVEYTLLDDWEIDDSTPESAGGAWLKDLADAMYAAGVWNITLTPNYNAGHANHFHLDLTPGADSYN